MKAIIQALKLPTNYKVLQFAKGNLADMRYVEVAALHSGTGGHTGALARYLDGKWSEIDNATYDATIREIFHLQAESPAANTPTKEPPSE